MKMSSHKCLIFTALVYLCCVFYGTLCISTPTLSLVSTKSAIITSSAEVESKQISTIVKPTSVSFKSENSKPTEDIENTQNLPSSVVALELLTTAVNPFPMTSYTKVPIKFQNITTTQSPPSPTLKLNEKSGKKVQDDLVHCPFRCICDKCKVQRDRIELKCKTRNLKRFLLKRIITVRKNVCSLMLAKSNITYLWKNAFQGFDNLQYLNLDENKLTKLDKGTFGGLKQLQTLSLRRNNLKKWKVNFREELPHINLLNIEGNRGLRLSRSFLENTTLTSILGLTVSTSCKDCNMSRYNATLKDVFPGPSNCKYLSEEYNEIAQELLLRLATFSIGKCKNNKRCTIKMVNTADTVLKNLYGDKCWETMNKLRPLLIVLGVVAILFNLVVVMIIVVTKSLRSKTSLLLIAHMSLCDILLGIYAVAVGAGQGQSLKDIRAFRSWRDGICPVYRTLFVLGQIMEVATSLLLTTERYLAIVHCMNPSVRLSKKLTSILLALFWLFAAMMGYMVQVHDRAIVKDNSMCLIVRSLKKEPTVDLFYTQGVMIVLVFLYLITLVQYCHIYITVRRSAQSSGARRESKVAFRICLMVFSSFVFFVIPNLAMTATTINSSLKIAGQPLNTILYVWLPPVLLIFNAGLNPFLFAYRNVEFVSTLKNIVSLFFVCNKFDHCVKISPRVVGNYRDVLEMKATRPSGRGNKALDASKVNEGIESERPDEVILEHITGDGELEK